MWYKEEWGTAYTNNGQSLKCKIYVRHKEFRAEHRLIIQQISGDLLAIIITLP
jgi:hypothetical protein